MQATPSNHNLANVTVIAIATAVIVVVTVISNSNRKNNSDSNSNSISNSLRELPALPSSWKCALEGGVGTESREVARPPNVAVAEIIGLN